ncbi:MAG: hypothetical protein V4722_04285 [Bacteroidota bacterium]
MFKTGKVKPYDASDFAMQNSRDLLEDIKEKLYAQCGDLDPNVLKVDICGVGTVFQPKDCSGANVGAPQKALQVVTLNKQIMQLCNVDELATAIGLVISGGSPNLYNTPQFILLDADNAITIAANTVHSLSYKVTAGPIGGTLSIDGATPVPIIPGESDGWQATTLLNKSFHFQALNGIIKIAITKP